MRILPAKIYRSFDSSTILLTQPATGRIISDPLEWKTMNPGSASPEEIREPQTQTAATGRRSKEPTPFKTRLGCWSFVVLMLGIFVVLPATTLFMQEYNNTHARIDRSCTVTEAEPHHSVNRKSRDSYKVLIDTSDCGDYELIHGVTESNYREIAQGLSPGEYRLELAATAVAFEELHKFFGNRVIVESLEKTPNR